MTDSGDDEPKYPSTAYGSVGGPSPDERTASPDWPLQIKTAKTSSELIIEDHARPVFQTATILPFLAALALTILPTVGLLTYTLVKRVATVSNCDNLIEIPRCTISQRTVVIDDPVQRFLTVTKVVDTVQQLAVVWTLSLAAFIIADTWIRSSDNPLTSKTLSLVVNMYASGRWWTLYDSAVSMYRKTAKISRPFVQALGLLLVTLLWSRVATGIDFWLHYVSREATIVYGDPSIQSDLSSLQFSRTPNTSCYNTANFVEYSNPCTVSPSSLGSNILTWRAAGSSLAVNQSTTDSVSLIYETDPTTGNQTTLAIVTPPTSAGSVNSNYNASTIGLSATCESISSACELLYVAHGTGSYNCTSLGNNTFAGYLSSSSYQPGLIYSSSPNNTQAGVPTTRYYIMALLSGNGTEFYAGGGDLNPSVLTAVRCSMIAYHVNYTYTAPVAGYSGARYTLQDKTFMNQNETETFLGPFVMTTPYIDDALSASKGAAQVSTSAFIRTFAQEVARFSLSYDAMAWSNSPVLSAEAVPEPRVLTLIPLIPLAIFFAIVFSYAMFVILLFVMTLRTGRSTVTIAGRLNSANQVTLTNLTQRRLVRTDFLLHQLLSRDERKSTITDADNIFQGEEDMPVIIGTHETSGVLGIYASAADPEVAPHDVHRRSTMNSVHRSPNGMPLYRRGTLSTTP